MTKSTGKRANDKTKLQLLAQKLYLTGTDCSSIGRELGVTRQTIYRWRETGRWAELKPVVTEKVREIAAVDAADDIAAQLKIINNLQNELIDKIDKQKPEIKSLEGAAHAISQLSRRRGELLGTEQQTVAPTIIFNIPRPEGTLIVEDEENVISGEIKCLPPRPAEIVPS